MDYLVQMVLYYANITYELLHGYSLCKTLCNIGPLYNISSILCNSSTVSTDVLCVCNMSSCNRSSTYFPFVAHDKHWTCVSYAHRSMHDCASCSIVHMILLWRCIMSMTMHDMNAIEGFVQQPASNNYTIDWFMLMQWCLNWYIWMLGGWLQPVMCGHVITVTTDIY